jgi:Sulfatase
VGWALGLVGLCGFVLAQPLFDLLRRFPGFFVAHRAVRGDLLVLALTLSFAVPLALGLPGLLLAPVSRRLARGTLAAAVGLVVALAAAQIAVAGGGSGRLVGVGLPLALGALGAMLWRAKPWARRGLVLLALAAPVFPALFLALPPIRGLLDEPPAQGDVAVPIAVRTPVVVLVLDELPLASLLDENEALDRGLFPHFAALARDGVWYRNATTVAESTPYAVPAILTGRYPPAEQLLPTLRDYPQNLFTLLGGSYNLHVVEAVTHLCPPQLCGGALPRPGAGRRRLGLLADVAAIYANLMTAPDIGWQPPALDDGWRDFWDLAPEGPPPAAGAVATAGPRWQQQGEIFDGFVAALDRFPPPTLHYLHILLPHAPWQTVPGGYSYQRRHNTGAVRDPERGDFVLVGTDFEIAQALQRHLLQVGYVDRLLGRLTDRLKELELYDQALIVVVADHGAAFRSGLSTRHTGEDLPTLADIANVPLIVKPPHATARGVDDRDVETIDILPTLLDALGVDPVGLALDGVPVGAAAPERQAKRLFPSWGVRSSRGAPIDFTVARLGLRRDAIRFKIEYLGQGSWQRVFAMGPHGDWVGRQETELARGDALDVTLDDEALFAAVDTSSTFLPLAIAGEVRGPGTGPRWLAVVVNGRIAAITRTVVASRRERFVATVSPAFFRDGRNTVTARPFTPAAS